MGLNALSLNDINKAYQTLLSVLPNADKQVQLRLANSLWYKNNFSVEDGYPFLLKKYFQATVFASRFNEQAIDSLNQWASHNTNGKIGNIVQSIDASTLIFLINALYFKGQWSSKFKEAQTKAQIFDLENGTTKPVKMMNQLAMFYYAKHAGYSVLRLPYGNGRFSMTIILPAKRNKIKDVMNKFSTKQWEEI